MKLLESELSQRAILAYSFVCQRRLENSNAKMRQRLRANFDIMRRDSANSDDYKRNHSYLFYHEVNMLESTDSSIVCFTCTWRLIAFGFNN